MYIAAIRKIIEIGNDDFSLPEQLLGTIFLVNNVYDSAFAHYKRALEIDTANIECRLNMYMYYNSVGDYGRKQILYNEIVALAPWLANTLRRSDKK